MGKLKKTSRTPFRFCPGLKKATSKSKSKYFDESHYASEKCEVKSLTICPDEFKLAVANISSNYSEDRLSALKLFLDMPMTKKNVRKFQEYNSIDIVSQLMTDSCIQLEATTFIRKLVYSNSFIFKESMVNCLLKAICPMITFFKHDDLSMQSQFQTDKCKSFINSVEVLTRLSELYQSAISIVNEEGIIHQLLKYVNPSQFGYPISLAVLQCLLCVTEANEFAAACILTDHLASLIIDQPEDNHQIYFDVLITGIIVNIANSEVNLVNPVFSVISQTIDRDIMEVCSNLPASSNCEQVLQANSLLSAQKLALEIITDICYINDESDDDNSGCGMEMDVDNTDSNEDDLLMVKNALHKYETVQKVLVKATLSLANLPNVEEYEQEIFKKVNCIKMRAVGSLINLSGFIDCKYDGGSVLYDIYCQLERNLITTDVTDQPLLEYLSIGMQTALENMCSENCQLLFQVHIDDLKNILDLAKSSTVQIALSHVVTSFCCFFIENLNENILYSGSQLAYNVDWANHLLQMASEASDMSVCAEALDMIIDLFSNDKTDKLAMEVKLVETLNIIRKTFYVQFLRLLNIITWGFPFKNSKKFVQKSKKRRKKLSKCRAVIETVRDNLFNFIKYKSHRIKNIK